ncbi:IclR family transcriptional regulator [Yinghuangia sp. YIM S09857]|uniref:IclR family transcriptional regulator n=1 Tax=Yinghuangia sp. YIM S09857 TaxID=3436929 RepID=UPI003F535634
MPERRSPPTERVTQVLNLLAEHPTEPLTLARIAQRLGISKPTCLGILTTLTETGFAHRTRDKAYRLGPALGRIGRVAEDGRAPLDALMPHLHALHRRLGLSCLLTTMSDDEIVVVGRAGAIRAGASRDLVGERFPAVPPLGLTELLWSGDQVLRDWLARTPLVPVTARRSVLNGVVQDARSRGYLVEHLTDGTPAARNEVLANLITSGMADTVIETLRGYLPEADWSEFADPPTPGPRDIATIHAPVHDRHGAQRYSIAVVASRRRVSPHTYDTWMRTTTQTAQDATKAINGWNPWHP